MPEEEAFEKGFRKCAAVDRQENLIAAIAERVERQGDQFLARAAAPGDQNGRLGIGDLLDQI